VVDENDEQEGDEDDGALADKKRIMNYEAMEDVNPSIEVVVPPTIPTMAKEPSITYNHAPWSAIIRRKPLRTPPASTASLATPEDALSKSAPVPAPALTPTLTATPTPSLQIQPNVVDKSLKRSHDAIETEDVHAEDLFVSEIPKPVQIHRLSTKQKAEDEALKKPIKIKEEAKDILVSEISKPV